MSSSEKDRVQQEDKKDTAMGSPVREALERQKKAAYVRLDAYYKQLLGLFGEIGVPEDDWNGRLGNIWGNVVATMQEEVEEEKRRVRQLTNNIDENGRRLLELAGQLGREVSEPDENLSLLQLDRELLQRLQALQAERDQLLNKMHTLREEESALCTALEMPPLTLSSPVPRDSDFREVREHISRLEAERGRRAAALVSLRQRLVLALEALEQSAQTELEMEVVWSPEQVRLGERRMAALEARVDELETEDTRNQQEGEKLMAKLKLLWNRLEVEQERRQAFLTANGGHRPSCLQRIKQEVEVHEELKRQNVETFVKKLRGEIGEMWERCYFSDSQRSSFTAFRSQTFTEQLLEEHEKELERLKAYFETNRVLLKDVDEHQRLWRKMLELEERANDPNRYANRGGQLLQEEKERKKIARRLPKVESDLQQLIASWETQHNATFLVHGHDFAVYIRQQKEDHEARREMEKEERANKKANQLEHETMFGARPVTPAKRRAAVGLERASPGKQRRLESTRLLGASSRLAAASPGPGRSARTPLALHNPSALSRNASLARTAPGKLTVPRELSMASDMSYADFARGLRQLQAAGAGGTSPALRAAARSRRRSQRLAGLPPATRTPRAGAGARGGTSRLPAASPRVTTPRSATVGRSRARLGLPALF